MADLEEAIRLGREAIDATPLDHPDRAGRLHDPALLIVQSVRLDTSDCPFSPFDLARLN
ncbi:hypothetical protein BKA56DRAFT_576426 [Ilyonectria sp. MPI-CAGE-AT-0026]|nr:hypothetical protein BKA56DRAFT_576426 [Ilyonectria sp. MPI-CAGE-AT-0026]